jgi:hypothetical protein
MRLLCLTALLCLSAAAVAAQSLTPDGDRDGLSDADEAMLLQQFAPLFMVASGDCAGLPARFTPLVPAPTIAASDGTIFGQASPAAGQPNQVELHYYDLWSTDCGRMGHALDAEHVSALVARDAQGAWRALYWYAAAHEDTVCDASQIARAATLDAEEHGPQVWISRGKHAAFLGQALCARGCGGDSCRAMEPLAIASLVNLGEPGASMNGAVWAESTGWPLADKLRRSDFPPARLDRLQQLPATDVAWANPDKRPMQAVILGGNDALDGGATGMRATDTALVIAHAHTANALSRATASTRRALAKSYIGVKSVLGAETETPTAKTAVH